MCQPGNVVVLTLCLADLPSFAADCTTTKLANLNGYTDYKELPWKTQPVDVRQIFLTKHVCENGKPYLSIEVHGPYSIETYSLPLEGLEELSELRRSLEKLHSEFSRTGTGHMSLFAKEQVYGLANVAAIGAMTPLFFKSLIVG